MNCIKCNSELPNGAKFCPSCGAFFGEGADVKPAAAPAPEQKYYCEKCGLELMRGARFCTVCGGAAKAPDITPTANNGETFGNGAMAAVSLDKTSVSDSLVSAMNSVTSEPKPSDSITSFSAPVSSDSASGTNLNFGSTATLPDYGTAVAVAPVKKKGVNIGVIIAAVVLVIVGSVAAIFFTNKAAFLSTFLGKPNYATMVEGNTIKDITSKIDAPALSNGVKSASSIVSAFATTNTVYLSSSDGSGSPEFLSASASSGPELDTAALIESLNEALTEVYGANSVKMTFSANASLTDSAKVMIGGGEDLDELLELINTTSLTYRVTSSDSAAAVTMGTEGKIAVDMRSLITEDGYIYLSFPFATDKALMIKCSDPSKTVDYPVLELDAAEIERLIGEVVELYLENYKASAIEMETGSLTAADVTVQGKLITAEFKGEALKKLFSDIAEHIADDDYFCNKIVAYVNECGGELTKAEYREEIIDAFDFDATNKDKLIIKTLIDKNGNVLGKSYTAKADNDAEAYFVYVEGKNTAAAECYYNDGYDEISVTCVDEKDTSTSGKLTVVVADDEQSLTLNVKYSGVEAIKFQNTETYVGTYEITVQMPADFKDQLGAEGFAAANGAKLILDTQVNGSTLTESVNLTVPQYGNVTLTAALSVSNETEGLTVPSNTLDITPIYSDNYAEAMGVYDELEEFGDEIMEAIKGLGIDLPSYITGSIGGVTTYPDDYWDDDDDWNWNDDDYWKYNAETDIPELLEFINEDMEEFKEIFDYYDLTPEQTARADAILTKYQELSIRIKVKGTSATEEEYDAFYDEYIDIWYESITLEGEFWNTGMSGIN